MAKKKSFKSAVKDAKKILDRLSDAIDDKACTKAGKDMTQVQRIIGGLSKAAKSTDKTKVVDLKDELSDLQRDFQKACRVKVKRKSSSSDSSDSDKYTSLYLIPEHKRQIRYQDDPVYNTAERRKLKKYRKRAKKEKSTDSYLSYLAKGIARLEEDSDSDSDDDGRVY